MKQTGLFLAVMAALCLFARSAPARPLAYEDLIAFDRIGSLAVSPDGGRMAFEVTDYLLAGNTKNRDIWLVGRDGSGLRRLTAADGYDGAPCWSPDGGTIAFVSDRDGTAQVWTIAVDGGEAVKLTDIATGAGGPVWSPDGASILVTSDVHPACTDQACNAEAEKAFAERVVKARVIESLLYRHWNHWREGKRSHVLLVPVDGGEVTDLTPGDFDVPPLSLGSRHDYTFSPDGAEVCFVKNTDAMIATSTNNDLFVVPTNGGHAVRLTDSPANDNSPHYSPDGRFIAYRAMSRPGFEADRYVLTLYDRATNRTRPLTADLDRSVGRMAWSVDSKKIFFCVQDEGTNTIHSVEVKSGKIQTILTGHTVIALAAGPSAKELFLTAERFTRPRELFRLSTDGKKLSQITDLNGPMLAGIEMNEAEDFRFEGALGDEIHGFLLKPPGFDASKKYPLVVLVHGGPQGAWEDEFHYRWNAQMFAAPGYVVTMVNFHGSTGYGQAFTDQISGDWGGACYEDVMKGLDYVLDNYDFVDPDRVGAAGASFGGYMVYWIAGHTDRFRCLVSHDGVFNTESMYGATEELWFPEWEFKGVPWDADSLYRKWSPHLSAGAYKTPMLVIHGENDFRVPVTEGLQAFTVLQRLGVPSKLLYFPDEDHFVQKPQNAQLWWKTIHDWFAQWLGEG